MTDVFNAQAEIDTLQERVAQCEKHILDLTAVMAGLNKANKNLVDFINAIPTNTQLIELLLQNMIALYDSHERALGESDAFNLTVDWFELPAKGCMGVRQDLVMDPDAADSIVSEAFHIFKVADTEQEFPETRESKPLRDFLIAQYKAGVARGEWSSGMTRYATIGRKVDTVEPTTDGRSEADH